MKLRELLETLNEYQDIEIRASIEYANKRIETKKISTSTEYQVISKYLDKEVYEVRTTDTGLLIVTIKDAAIEE